MLNLLRRAAAQELCCELCKGAVGIGVGPLGMSIPASTSSHGTDAKLAHLLLVHVLHIFHVRQVCTESATHAQQNTRAGACTL